MTSNVLSSLGLGNIDIGYILIGSLVLFLILLVLLIVTMVKQSKLKKRYEAFMLGSDAKSMEEEISGLFQDINTLKGETKDNKKEIKHIYRRLETVFQKIGIVKYDAFQQMGGKLSFSLALLDENDNGFIMNSVHSTDGCYSYTKEIKNGECEISLGEEEQKALDMAMNHEMRGRKSADRKTEKTIMSARMIMLFFFILFIPFFVFCNRYLWIYLSLIIHTKLLYNFSCI